MPFVKRAAAPSLPPVPDAPDLASLLQALSGSNADMRWDAARSLGGCNAAVPALAAALDAEQSPRVREAIVTALVRVGDEASVAALLPYLRSSDAAMRTTAIEALQALPQKTAPLVAVLLNDAESDVRILATELTRSMPIAEATALLCDLLRREQHPNVCAAAVEVLAAVGTREALPVLQDCSKRFADIPFLPFAIATAIARISPADD